MLMEAKKPKFKPSAVFDALYAKAVAAGAAALEACKPHGMLVGSAKSLFGSEIDASKPVYYVEGGACGFAWVKIRPGSSAFAKWLVGKGYARGAYDGGVDIWIREGGQSMERKEAYAEAMAKVFREEGGIEKCYSQSRMD